MQPVARPDSRIPDRATVRVHLGRIEVQLFGDRAGLRCERFVRFDHVDLLDAQAGLGQHFPDGGYRAGAHHLRFDTGMRVADQPRQRAATSHRARPIHHQHNRRRRIVDPRRVAGRHRTVFSGRPPEVCCKRFELGIRAADARRCLESASSVPCARSARAGTICSLKRPLGDRR